MNACKFYTNLRYHLPDIVDGGIGCVVVDVVVVGSDVVVAVVVGVVVVVTVLENVVGISGSNNQN